MPGKRIHVAQFTAGKHITLSQSILACYQIPSNQWQWRKRDNAETKPATASAGPMAGFTI